VFAINVLTYVEVGICFFPNLKKNTILQQDSILITQLINSNSNRRFDHHDIFIGGLRQLMSMWAR